MDYRLRTVRSAAEVRAGKRDWFSIRNAGDEARIDIYDEIGFFGITAQDFLGELKSVNARTIALHMNSVGGDVFDGIAIRNALVQHPATVNVTVDGIAASIASVITTAGDSVEMAKGALMMTHMPFALVIGSSSDMRSMAEALDKMAGSIAGFYAERSKTTDEWLALMEAETWFTDEEAVEIGLADRVSKAPAVQNHFDLSIFRNGPKPEEAAVATEPDWRKEARQKIAGAMEGLYAHAG